MTEKVLLLHGPMISRGINPITHNLHRDEAGRESSRSDFNCDQTVLGLAYVFRQYGYKVVYSGWQDDAAWLEANRASFDHLVVSDQSVLAAHSIAVGKVVVNNKEKLYFGALQGLRLIGQQYGEDCIVFRLRSDVAVDHRLAMREMNRIGRGSRDILVEYLNTEKMFSSPDFMLMGELPQLLAIYESLYGRSAAGDSYHVSSHVDHCFTYMQLMEDGVINRMLCMDRPIFDSVVWRGVPRYFEYAFPQFAERLFFQGEVVRDPNIKVATLLASVPPELSGKQPPR